jgi:hypothetical protein
MSTGKQPEEESQKARQAAKQRKKACNKTIVLRMTSKRVKELLDKMRPLHPPAVVRWKRLAHRGQASGLVL